MGISSCCKRKKKRRNAVISTTRGGTSMSNVTNPSAQFSEHPKAYSGIGIQQSPQLRMPSISSPRPPTTLGHVHGATSPAGQCKPLFNSRQESPVAGLISSSRSVISSICGPSNVRLPTVADVATQNGHSPNASSNRSLEEKLTFIQQQLAVLLNAYNKCQHRHDHPFKTDNTSVDPSSPTISRNSIKSGIPKDVIEIFRSLSKRGFSKKESDTSNIYRLFKELKQDGYPVIIIEGEVDPGNITTWSGMISTYIARGCKTLLVLITGDGGLTKSGIWFAKDLVNIRKTITVIGIAIGEVASATAIIFSCMSKRYVIESTSIMFHRSGIEERMTAADMDEAMASLKKEDDEVDKVLAAGLVVPVNVIKSKLFSEKGDKTFDGSRFSSELGFASLLGGTTDFVNLLNSVQKLPPLMVSPESGTANEQKSSLAVAKMPPENKPNQSNVSSPKRSKPGTPKKEGERQKAPNWSSKDSCLLVDLYEKYHAIIVGQFKGTKITAKTKEEAWSNLENEFNKSSVDHRRNADEIKYKISNVKNEARKYATALKHCKTGGGPKPDDPAAFVSKMYDIVHGSTGDAMIGIGAGVESGTDTQQNIVKSDNDDEIDFDNKVLMESEIAVRSITNPDAPFATPPSGDAKLKFPQTLPFKNAIVVKRLRLQYRL